MVATLIADSTHTPSQKKSRYKGIASLECNEPATCAYTLEFPLGIAYSAPVVHVSHMNLQYRNNTSIVQRPIFYNPIIHSSKGT